jgi:hypothetical protein
MSKDIARCWEFPSGSNPNKKYEALQYTDGSTSCNCMGWTRRVAADGTRSCKHTRMIDMGSADSACISSHDYTQQAPRRAVETPAPKAELAAPRKAKGPEMTTVLTTRKVLFRRRPTSTKD